MPASSYAIGAAGSRAAKRALTSSIKGRSCVPSSVSRLTTIESSSLSTGLLSSSAAVSTAAATAATATAPSPQPQNYLHAALHQRQQQLGVPTYRYPFPSIPRPRRNLLYYNPLSSLRSGLIERPAQFVKSSSSGVIRKMSMSRNKVISNKTMNGLRSVRRFSSSAPQKLAKKDWVWVKWWAVPAVTTIILLSILRRRQQQQKQNQNQQDNEEYVDADGKKHKHPKPAKPWQVAAYSTLPLKAMSRLWGRFNDITLPVWMREPGFKLYSYVFGVNLDEVAEDDLTKYANLGEFFFRELKPGSRPIDPDSVLVSPADGKVLHLGVINNVDRKVEQVKGITYSLDALLGGDGAALTHAAPSHDVDFEALHNQEEVYERHREFAVMNGIHYTLDDLIGTDERLMQKTMSIRDQGDASMESSKSQAVMQVSKDVLAGCSTPNEDKELFFAVIYLAPGDYHRFHSPASWVAELRRHFVGELYSVAPYFQHRLQGLFCLNERVALLGRWKYGFFSMTPVGATNVGSIRVHFDKNLQTNTVYEQDLSEVLPQQPPPGPQKTNSSSSISSVDSTDSTDSMSSVDSQATLNDESKNGNKQKRKKVKKSTCYEATYAKASKVLGGYPLTKGQEMGGFNLGSTVVLVFEAPKEFQFSVSAGEKVKVGQAMGSVRDS